MCFNQSDTIKCTIKNCVICCEDNTDEITCPKCSNSCCVTCYQKYCISGNAPICMFCKAPHSIEFVAENTSRKFFNSDFHEFRQRLVLQTEMGILEEAIQDLEIDRKIEQASAEVLRLANIENSLLAKITNHKLLEEVMVKNIRMELESICTPCDIDVFLDIPNYVPPNILYPYGRTDPISENTREWIYFVSDLFFINTYPRMLSYRSISISARINQITSETVVDREYLQSIVNILRHEKKIVRKMKLFIDYVRDINRCIETFLNTNMVYVFAQNIIALRTRVNKKIIKERLQLFDMHIEIPTLV